MQDLSCVRFRLNPVSPFIYYCPKFSIKIPPPESIYFSTEKAKFSPITTTFQEIKLFECRFNYDFIISLKL